MTVRRTPARLLALATAGGALCIGAAAPAGAATGPGLLTASQLPKGYTALTKPVSVSGSKLLQQLKSLPAGIGTATSACKGSPTAASLAKDTLHLVAFGSGLSGDATSPKLVAEIVLSTPSSASATSYFNALAASTAHCASKQTVTVSGVKVAVSYAVHHVSTPTEGATSAVGFTIALAGKVTEDGSTATLKGSLTGQAYRKGSDVVETLVDGFSLPSDAASSKNLTITFRPGSAALAAAVGKAAVRDL